MKHTIITKLSLDQHGRTKATTATVTIEGHADRARVSYDGLGRDYAHLAACRAMLRRMKGSNAGPYMGAPIDAKTWAWVPVAGNVATDADQYVSHLA